MIWVLFSVLAGADQPAPVVAPADAPTIVVRAERTKQKLDECLARQCGTREDAIATIRHAQSLFAQAEYRDAQYVLKEAIARNGKATATEPRALAALWHALARVTLHDGDMQEYRRAALRSGSILARAESLGPGERLAGKVQIADAMWATGDRLGAERRFKAAADDARARGEEELADMLSVRAIAARTYFDDLPATRRKLREAAADPRLAERARGMALALATKLEARSTAKLAKILDEFPAQPAERPLLLIWAPKDRYAEEGEAAGGIGPLTNIALAAGSEVKRYSWADVGFWVRPDGSVEDVELLRSSQTATWSDEVKRVIAGRRYAPFEAPFGSEGRYRIERVTLTYDYVTPIGSLIRRRGGAPVLRFEELQVENGNRVVLDRP